MKSKIFTIFVWALMAFLFISILIERDGRLITLFIATVIYGIYKHHKNIKAKLAERKNENE
ncbi:MAG: hypothetical protein A3A83_02145 [Candidatus Doudnabacteria bacterium RIFCSPLOWO2_01_FULL_48_57]|nr:MAG: hypothetical protein A3A83_02145 [Candidatus Doudnabacteria bacterium RIFCSPLOWO2_01_FULL_48_57]